MNPVEWLILGATLEMQERLYSSPYNDELIDIGDLVLARAKRNYEDWGEPLTMVTWYV